MATPENITFEEAQGLVSPPAWVEVARKLVGRDEDAGDVDHWQEGDGYKGRLPDGSDPNRDSYVSALKKAFITEDLCSDVLERRTDGVLGKDPNFRYEIAGEEPNSDEEERQAAVEEWWANQGAGQVLVDFLDAISTEQRTCLRLRVLDPEASPSSPAEALEQIHVEQVGRDEATVHTDRDTQRQTGIFLSSGDGDEEDQVELTYLNEDGATVLEIQDEDGDQVEEEWTGDLGGRLLMYEGEGRLLLSESIRSNQFSLNTKRTWIEIVDEKAGFPELHLVNLEVPTDEEGNPQKPKRRPNGLVYHVAIPNESVDENNNEVSRSGNPQVNQFGAADTKNLREDCQEARYAIYRTAKQLHIFMSGDATASGESRIQARADYVKDLRKLKGAVDKAGRWLLETVWALAEALSDTGYSGASAVFDAIIDPGPITAEERKAMLTEVAQGAMSLERFLSVLGIDDPQAEIDRIRDEIEEGPVMRGQAETARVLSGITADAAFQEIAGTVAERRQQIETEAEE